MKKIMWRAVTVLLLGTGLVRAQAPEAGPPLLLEQPGPVSQPAPLTEVPAATPPSTALTGEQLPALDPGMPFSVEPVAQEEPEGKPENLPEPKGEGHATEEAPVLKVSKEEGVHGACTNCTPREGIVPKLWAWLSYRPTAGRCCCNCIPQCNPCGMPPLYTFFLCDKYDYPPAQYGCASCKGH